MNRKAIIDSEKERSGFQRLDVLCKDSIYRITPTELPLTISLLETHIMDYKTPKISEGTVFVPSILSVVKTRDLKIESDCKFPLSSVSYIDQE